MFSECSIVCASEFWLGSTPAGLAHGLRAAGWDVPEVDLHDHMLFGRTLPMRVAARAIRSLGIASYNATVVDEVRLHRPMAFLTVKGTYLSSDTLHEVRRMGVTTVNYFPDYHFQHHHLDEATFPLYDLFVTTKSFQVDYLNRLLGAGRVRFVHHGYANLVHRPRLAAVSEDDFVADVLYVGNHTPYKQRWIDEIARRLPEARLMIVGGGWNGAMARLTPRTKVISRVVRGDTYARLVQSARINLALHSGPFPQNGWEDLVSTRTFEIPACKGFMLHIDNPEIRTLFEPGREIDTFKTPEELSEKVGFYLARPELRAEMIERAYTRCVPAYSYDARAQDIVRALADMSAAPKLRSLISDSSIGVSK